MHISCTKYIHLMHFHFLWEVKNYKKAPIHYSFLKTMNKTTKYRYPGPFNIPVYIHRVCDIIVDECTYFLYKLHLMNFFATFVLCRTKMKSSGYHHCTLQGQDCYCSYCFTCFTVAAKCTTF